MELPKPRDEDDEEVLGLIRKRGVFIQSVMGDGTGTDFGYSMGLTHTFGHPEVLISGLRFELHVSMINEICKRLKAGEPHLSHGERVSGLLSGFDCIAARLPDHAGHNYVYYAQWLHNSKDVPLIQLIWPSTSGVWSWEKNAPVILLENQEILLDVEEFRD